MAIRDNNGWYIQGYMDIYGLFGDITTYSGMHVTGTKLWILKDTTTYTVYDGYGTNVFCTDYYNYENGEEKFYIRNK